MERSDNLKKKWKKLSESVRQIVMFMTKTNTKVWIKVVKIENNLLSDLHIALFISLKFNNKIKVQSLKPKERSKVLNGAYETKQFHFIFNNPKMTFR